MKHMKLVLVGVLVSSAAWAVTRAPAARQGVPTTKMTVKTALLPGGRRRV
jgi:hypothetical protein